MDLSSFSSIELAAVGAGSPIRGLVADGAFLALDDATLAEMLGRARHGLADRGLVGVARPARRSELDTGPIGDGPAREGDPVDFQLGGDLAGIVAVRRAPALLGTVSAGPPELYRHPGSHPESEAVLAVLHGVASEGVGLIALLEETTVGPGVHLFTLNTPAAQATRIFDAWQDLETDGPAAVSVQVFVPHPARPRRVQLVLETGVARLSHEGSRWQRSTPEDGWSNLFRGAVAL